MTFPRPGHRSLACLGPATTSAPSAPQAALRDVLKVLPKVTPGQWPCLLVALCWGILGFLTLWALVKAILSAGVSDPADGRAVRGEGKHPGEGQGPADQTPQGRGGTTRSAIAPGEAWERSKDVRNPIPWSRDKGG